VQGAGCGVLDAGFRVWGVGCGVWGVGCGVQGVGCIVQGVGCRVWDVGCSVQCAGCGVYRSLPPSSPGMCMIEERCSSMVGGTCARARGRSMGVPDVIGKEFHFETLLNCLCGSYCTNDLLLLTKIMLCSKIPRQKD
jgi:hypothetical protein